MLNPITGFEPGLLVRYHGSLTTLHGLYQAHPCHCLRCDDPIVGSARFRLLDDQGQTVVTCVRARSLTPEDEPDEGTHEDCTGIHRSGDGYRDCDGNPV